MIPMNYTTQAYLTLQNFVMTALLALLSLLIFALPANSATNEADGIRVLILSTNMARAGQQAKFAALIETGAEHGYVIDYVFDNDLDPAQATTQFAEYQLLILDSMTGSMGVSRLIKNYREALDASTSIRILAHHIPDSDIHRKIQEAQAVKMDQYLFNGGKENFRRFFTFLDVEIFSRSKLAIKPPIIFPSQGFYHPDAPSLVFDSLDSYLQWRTVDNTAPVVGIGFHLTYLTADSMAPVDAAIRALQAKGVTPLAFFTEIGSDDSTGRKMLEHNGKPIIDVILNFQIMVIGQHEMRADYERMGVPILHALYYRAGDEAAWAADMAGIELSQLPLSLIIPETMGYVDPLVVAAIDKQSQRATPITVQLDSAVNKAIATARLAHKPNAEKKIAIVFYNYPPGVTNLGAAFLNIPASMEQLLLDFQQRGYQLKTFERSWLEKNAHRTLLPMYEDNAADEVLEAGFAALLPLADYQHWFRGLPQETRDAINGRWGDAEESAMIVQREGIKYFLIPRIEAGNLILLPQPRRSERADSDALLYHDKKVPINHYYLATYLYLREHFEADALVHLGTHGTQEWTAGKERGGSIYDNPYLILGDIPVIYPYITNNLAEAITAKRRGRATLISHQTPPFAVTGTYEVISEIQSLTTEYATAHVEAVKQQVKRSLLEKVEAEKLHEDMQWTVEAMHHNTDVFVTELQDYLLGLSGQAQPLGMHTLGTYPERKHMISTLALMVGKKFMTLAEGDENAWAKDYKTFPQSRTYQLLADYVLDDMNAAEVEQIELRAGIELAREYYKAFQQQRETASVLDALEGKYIKTSVGGDPIRSPASLPTGRNMYGFDPFKVPTKAAWETGKKMVDEMIDDFVEKHGRYPEKMAFNLWSLETMRHFGVLEAQILYTMGVRPVWNEEGMVQSRINAMVKDRLSSLPGGIADFLASQVTVDRLQTLSQWLPESVVKNIPVQRMIKSRNMGKGNVTASEIIPSQELGRPRIDVVISATGLYRDTFPNVMLRIAEGVELAAKLKEENNFVFRHSQQRRQQLLDKGLPEDEVEILSTVRIFSPQRGYYGNGVSDSAMATDTWESDDKLSDTYLERMGYYYGSDERSWGKKIPDVDLYAKNLSGSDALIFSRTSNLYGLLTSDDPFGYFGSMAMAIRNLDGDSPESWISNLRDPDNPINEPTSRFMAKELRGRYFHPNWIAEMQAEGYSGTLGVLDAMNNFWGWQVVDPKVVREDQWQQFHEVYVNDKYDMGIREWFEQSNPHALAQMAELMLEAIRKEYWQPDDKTVQELIELYKDFAERYQVKTDNEKFKEFLQNPTTGFGLTQAAPAMPMQNTPPPAAPPPEPAASKMEQVQGQALVQVVNETESTIDYQAILLISLLFGISLLGFGWQWFEPKT